MSMTHVCLLSVLILGCSESSQPAPAKETSETPPSSSGRLTLVSQTSAVQLGRIQQGKTVDVPFLVQNTGDQPVRIVQTTGSCSCTKVKCEQDVIAPGESGTVIAKVDTARKHGSFSINVTTVYSGLSPHSRKKKLVSSATGTVYIPNRLTFVPRVTQLGDVEATKPIQLTISTSLNTEKDFSEFPYELEFPDWVSQATVQTVQHDNSWNIEINATTPDEPGPFTGSITFRASNDVLTNEVTRIDGYVVPEITASPRTVTTVAKHGSTVSPLNVRFQHANQQLIRPKSVILPSLPNGHIDFEWESTEPGQDLVLQLNVTIESGRVLRGTINTVFDTEAGEVIVPVALVIVSKS